jgi:cell division protein FtsL
MRDYQRTNQEIKNITFIGKSDSIDKSNIFVLVGIVFVVLVVALFFVYQSNEFVQTERKVRKLLLEKRAIISRIMPMKLEESYLSQLGKVERYAKRNLNMIYPKKREILKVKLYSIPPAE